MKTLVEYNGLFFNEGTNPKVKQIISNNIGREKRFRVWYGDTKTGKSWNEENDVCGYFGKSTGITPISMLVNNTRSFGGGALLTDCIVKIVDIKTKTILFQHENFNQPNFSWMYKPKDGKTNFIVKIHREAVIEKEINIKGRQYKMINRIILNEITNDSYKVNVICSVNDNIGNNEYFLKTKLKVNFKDKDNILNIFIGGEKFKFYLLFEKKITDIKI